MPHVDTSMPNDCSIFTRSWHRWKLKESWSSGKLFPGYGVRIFSLVGYAASPMLWYPSGRRIVALAREDRVHADQSFAAPGAMIETLQTR